MNPRHLAGTDLALALQDARARTWACVDDLDDAQWLPPHQSGVNPIAWELAHLAWFAEYWTLRGPHGRDVLGFANSPVPPRFAGPDAHFDSARLAHAARWTTPLPARGQLKDMLAAQLAASLSAIPSGAGAPDEQLYFHRLSLFHEDMHAEAFCWLRAALGYSCPKGLRMDLIADTGELQAAGGQVQIGRPAGQPGFAFDNECDGATLSLKPFSIDSAPVSALAFSRFVDAGGYDNPAFWPAEAGVWRAQSGLSHPQKWRRSAKGGWQMRWFDQWLQLTDSAAGSSTGGQAVIHINAFEAQAYCLWAKRRLPSAAEWEHAATTLASFQWGHSVWEWTADNFEPYPGFHPGPYREYSQPWFGNHRELRGGAFATHARLHDPGYRNFFLPQRSDIFAGFRTVAI